MLLIVLSFVFQLLFPSVQPFSTYKDTHHAATSKHNKSFFYPKYRPEIFPDNRLLPEDSEVDVFLHKNQIQKLFFLLEGGYRPISVTVTPCSSETTLEWKISHNSFQTAALGSTYNSALWANHVLRPPSTSPAATYVGKDRRSYTNPRAPPGLYALEMRADGETRARILVTTRPPSQMSYHPPVPPESNVHIIKIKRNRVLVSWKASQSGRPVEYCVTANTRGNYNSLCSAESDLYGSTPFQPPMSPGYHRSHALISSNPHPLYPKHGAKLTCVGRKTWHQFKGLQRGKTYYLDVFVIDKETNASSAYIGVSAAVKNVISPTSRLKDNSLVTFNLDETNGYAVNTKYSPGRTPGPILLFIQSCTGPGPVILDISRNTVPKEEILSTNVMDVKTLEIPRLMAAPLNSTSNLYLFSIRSSVKHPRKVRVWISGKKHAFPFPVLPEDKSVSVFDTLTTCDSITIGWKTSSDERVKYCIYKQSPHNELMRRTLAEPQNFCEPPIDGSTRRHTVLCRRYHRFSKRRFNNVIMQRVRGLHPGTTYLFEVQVTKVKGKMLPYEQVWANTLDTCSRSRNKR
ncbi:protein NDNF-like isoform X2 [Stegodyphus dumicola]|nr:protein NDNF-like isoform X2 [Stegodyphus dumicola]XP_035217209.1 protein NDNF-like isoform X2 [Stegodyphus dumicola]XP_035217210.1 protein NDNF-like isoform X2 [Stegodyphus dumicola]XP_035217211.1 protein NDNF-like isoform X2 [Stegodyphus dumicola]